MPESRSPFRNQCVLVGLREILNRSLRRVLKLKSSRKVGEILEFWGASPWQVAAASRWLSLRHGWEF